MHLAGDIGGSKTVLGTYPEGADPRNPTKSQQRPTRECASPTELLDGVGPVESATLAVAGAVIDGVATGSNLPWHVDAATISRALQGVPVRLLNDLEATAIFVPHLRDDEIETLNPGVPRPGGAIGVIAPGTGIGQAMLVHLGGTYHAMPSEAGHTDFAPSNERQADYLGYLRERFGHVSLERACSGSGFVHLFHFLSSSGFPAHPDIIEAIRSTADPTPAIIEAGMVGQCTACSLALDMFVDMLGSAAGNLALQIVATGGIYLGGGIPPRILPALQQPRFLTAFTDKGRFHDLAAAIPVHVILESRAALYGAATRALGGRAAR